MKTHSTFFLVLYTCLSAFSQYNISGIITDTNTQPLIGANIYINTLQKGTTSNIDGTFNLDNLPNGNYILQVSYVGFIIDSINISIKNKDISNIKIALKENRTFICPVVITSHWLNLKDPYAYTNLGAEEIKSKNQGQDVPYLLQDMASVVVTSDAGAGIGYTGIRVRGSDPTRTNVTINGIPFNDAESQGSYWVDLPDFAGSVDEIQLQKGVGPSVIGAGAFGATLNLNTNAIASKTGLSYNGTVGSFNTIKHSIKIETGLLKSGWALEGRLSSITSQGYIDRASSDLKSSFIGINYLKNKHSFRLNLFQGHEITYQAWNGVPVQYINDPEKRTYNSAGLDRPGSPYENEVDNYKQTHLQGFYTTKINANWNLNIALHYTKGFGYYENYKGQKTLSNYDIDPIIEGLDTIIKSDIIRRKYLDNDFYGVIPTLQYNHSNYNLTIGGGWSNYKGHHYGEIIDVIDVHNFDTHEFYRNEASKKDLNLYSKINYFLNNKLSVYGDLQYRQVLYTYDFPSANMSPLIRDVTHHFINPKVGLVYSSGPSNAYFSISKGSKEPGRIDYVNVALNQVPRAEKLLDYELGYQYTRGNKWAFRSNIYYMDYKDQLVLTGALNNVGDALRSNVKNSYRMGIEIEMEHILMQGAFKKFGVQLHGTLSQNRIKEAHLFIDNWNPPYTQREVTYNKSPISYSPNAVGGASMSWFPINNKKRNLSIEFSEKYVGAQYLDNSGNSEAKLDAYFNENLSISYGQLLYKKMDFTIKFTLKNLLDREYITNGWIYRFDSVGYNPVNDDPSALAVNEDNYVLKGLYPQAGRYFLLSLSVNWQK